VSQKRRSPFDHGNREESDAAINQGMQAAAGNWGGKEQILHWNF